VAYNVKQFSDLISRTLVEIGLHSQEAVDLLLGTAAQESQFGTYLRQLGGGPALGAFQVELVTFDDLQFRYANWVPFVLQDRHHKELEWDLKLGIIVARLKYYSCPGPVPLTLRGQARYWKKYYNTEAGAGTVDEYLENWKRYVGVAE
jgi:hypothetical protein